MPGGNPSVPSVGVAVGIVACVGVGTPPPDAVVGVASAPGIAVGGGVPSGGRMGKFPRGVTVAKGVTVGGGDGVFGHGICSATFDDYPLQPVVGWV